MAFNQRIKNMQSALITAGYDVGNSGADGSLGPKTREAAKLAGINVETWNGELINQNESQITANNSSAGAGIINVAKSYLTRLGYTYKLSSETEQINENMSDIYNNIRHGLTNAYQKLTQPKSSFGGGESFGGGAGRKFQTNSTSAQTKTTNNSIDIDSNDTVEADSVLKLRTPQEIKKEVLSTGLVNKDMRGWYEALKKYISDNEYLSVAGDAIGHINNKIGNLMSVASLSNWSQRKLDIYKAIMDRYAILNSKQQAWVNTYISILQGAGYVVYKGGKLIKTINGTTAVRGNIENQGPIKSQVAALQLQPINAKPVPTIMPQKSPNVTNSINEDMMSDLDNTKSVGLFGNGIIDGVLKDRFIVNNVEVCSNNGEPYLLCTSDKLANGFDKLALYINGRGINLGENNEEFKWTSVEASKINIGRSAIRAAALGGLFAAIPFGQLIKKSLIENGIIPPIDVSGSIAVNESIILSMITGALIYGGFNLISTICMKNANDVIFNADGTFITKSGDNDGTWDSVPEDLNNSIRSLSDMFVRKSKKNKQFISEVYDKNIRKDMKKNILTYLSKIEGFKTRIKEIHWVEPTIPGHELAGAIEDDIKSFQDSIAEDFQGTYNVDIKPKQLKPIAAKSTTMLSLIDEIISETESFYKTLKGDKLIGVRSEVEGFIHGMKIKKYLCRKTVKEAKETDMIIKNITAESVRKTIFSKPNVIKEGRYDKMRVTNNCLNDIVSESTKYSIEQLNEALGTFGAGVINGKLNKYFRVERVELSEYQGKTCLKCYCNRWFGKDDNFILFYGGKGINLDENSRDRDFTWTSIYAPKTSFAKNVLVGAGLGAGAGAYAHHISNKISRASVSAAETAAREAGVTEKEFNRLLRKYPSGAGHTKESIAQDLVTNGGKEQAEAERIADAIINHQNGTLNEAFAGLLGRASRAVNGVTREGMKALGHKMKVGGGIGGAIGGIKALWQNINSGILYYSDGTFKTINGKTTGNWYTQINGPEDVGGNESPSGGGERPVLPIDPSKLEKPRETTPRREVPTATTSPSTSTEVPVRTADSSTTSAAQGGRENPIQNDVAQQQVQTPQEKRHERMNQAGEDRLGRKRSRYNRTEKRFDDRTDTLSNRGASQKRIDNRNEYSDKMKARHDKNMQKATAKQDKKIAKRAERDAKKNAK